MGFEAQINLLTGGITVKVAGDTPKTLFKEIAKFQEVFGEKTCGLCGSSNIRFRVRTVTAAAKGRVFEYHELACLERACRARLAFGENMEGGNLFPKRKDENGQYLPNGGWVKYVKPDGEKDKEPWE